MISEHMLREALDNIEILSGVVAEDLARYAPGREKARVLITSAFGPSGISGINKANQGIPRGLAVEVGANVLITRSGDMSLMPTYRAASGITRLHANIAEHDQYNRLREHIGIV